jgi:hypothetical protein
MRCVSVTRLLALSVALAAAVACNAPPTAAEVDGTRGGRVDVFFNDPGTRPQNQWDPDAIRVMVDLIDGASATIDFAVMGFSRATVIARSRRAYDRGVRSAWSATPATSTEPAATPCWPTATSRCRSAICPHHAQQVHGGRRPLRVLWHRQLVRVRLGDEQQQLH